MDMVYVFRKQFGQTFGVFAGIEFSITEQAGDGFSYTCAYEGNPTWQIPCMMGLMLFKEYLRQFRSGDFNVKVLDVNWLPADTNDLAVFYATVKGLAEHFELAIPGLNFHPETAIYHLPDWRNVKPPQE